VLVACGAGNSSTPAAVGATSPILLRGGNADPNVFRLNTQLMQGYWAAHAPPSTPDSVLDLDSTASNGDPYADPKNQFSKLLVAASAIAQGASDGSAGAIADVYHGTLVPPFWLSEVRSFFAAR
jgi:hypothetical protein